MLFNSNRKTYVEFIDNNFEGGGGLK